MFTGLVNEQFCAVPEQCIQSWVMRVFLFLSLIFLSFPGFAADDERILVEQATFSEAHDPGWLILKTAEGNEYTGDFYYRFIEYEDLKTWEKGEKFNVVIANDVGAGIVRHKTNKFYKVFFREQRHPIDVQLKKCNGFWNDCLIDASNQWIAEHKFAFDNFLETLEDQELKQGFIETQDRWKAYTKSMHQSFRSIPNYEGGTYGATLAAWLYVDLEKSRFFHILRFYD